mgnify:CR=1 FL=1
MDYDDNKDSYTVELENQDGSTATEKWTSNRVAQGQKLFEIADAKVAKDFDGEIYQGRVVDVSRDEADGTNLIHILYGDGDEEDYDEAELEEGQDMYKREFASKPKRKSASKSSRNNGSSSSNNKNNKKVPTKESTKKDVEPMEEEPEEVDNGKKRSRRRRKVNYNEDAMMDLLNTDEEEEEERKPPAKKQKAFQKKRKSRMDDDEDDEFEMDEAFDADSDEDDDDDDLDAEMLVDEEEEEEEEEEVKPKKSRKKAPAKRTAASKKKSARKESDSDEEEADDNINSTDGEYDAEYRKKLAKDRASFKPNNNPQKWPKDAFVEPVGVDPTHGIVEGIILNQVKKVGKLLALVAKNEKDKVKGEISFPIQLQTACSGTDAPSIALGLVEEALNKLYSKEEHGFQYSHVMSCEIEAFKQAYIGRNFPGVPLFPDITKLTDGEFVEDVYGRKQRVPQGNLFIAGTSCKDFSMLKNSDRKDIEDKGTSGETFLAAVELLDAHERPCAIFENVDGAPWGKMQEYIQGRLYLPDRNVTKAIKEASKKAGT